MTGVYPDVVMGGFTVFFLAFLISHFICASAVKKTHFSERLQNSLHPFDQRSQIQLRELDTDRSNPCSCHCTCNCTSQPTRDYGLRPICPSYYSNCDGWSLERSRDCQELYQRGYNKTGVYVIYPGGLPEGIYVRCDMETDGGGWTVIQRRVSGDVDFSRNWSDYKKGFGDLNGNFWIGNDNIHAITSQGNYQLRIDLTLSDTNKPFATYSTFNVGDENSGYILMAGGYRGTAGDSLKSHVGYKFSTKDRDNDIAYDASCAELYKGGWWYSACHQSNLNGVYGSTAYGVGINWSALSGYYTSMVYADMKVRKQ